MPSISLTQPLARLPFAFEGMFNRLTGRWWFRKDFDFIMGSCPYMQESPAMSSYSQQYPVWRSHSQYPHPPVFCVADLLEPPPEYQQHRNAPPVVGELEILQAALYRCQSQSSNGNHVERELLDADAEHLSQWIEHLENLVYMEAATTIPSRYQQESTIARTFKRVFKRNKNRQT
jgi:hypothetical protein